MAQTRLTSMHARASAGFTLVELVVVVALIAIVVTQGIPWLESTTLNAHRTAEINSFISHLNTARTYAINGDDIDASENGCPEGCRVTLCKSTDLTSCDTSSTVGWESGWIMFWDYDADAIVDAADGDRLIRVEQPLSTTSTLRGNTNVRNKVTFDITGFSNQTGSFAWCDSRGFGSEARVIVISSVGRTNVVDAATSSLNSCTP